MKIVVIGGTGLIGTKVVELLRGRGHEAVAASPSSGVDTLTGEGLALALAHADAVVDVSNSPSFEPAAVLDFFQTSTRNILHHARADHVRHYVALSIVGVTRPRVNGYFRAKAAQEALIQQGGVPYTIVRATQFYEFMGAIAQTGETGDVVTLSTAPMQPIAADDVALAVVDAVLAPPVNGLVEVAGPTRAPLAALVERYLQAIGDPRRVVASADATYFGAVPDAQSLVPEGTARIGAIDYGDWLARNARPSA